MAWKYIDFLLVAPAGLGRKDIVNHVVCLSRGKENFGRLHAPAARQKTRSKPILELAWPPHCRAHARTD